MSLKAIENFEIDYVQIMNEFGEADAKSVPKLSKDQLLEMYFNMLLARKFDEKALNLQRQGRIGTYASVKGQEACQVGVVSAITDNDWVVPAFREGAAWVSRKVPLEKILQYWGGDERGSQIEGKNVPVAIPVGTHLPYAAGLAWGEKLKKSGAVSVVFFGDGATSKGDFHEALNFSGVLKLPVIFVCQNNQFAISVPRSKQTAAETIAQKAIAYGIHGIQVDGNDVLAVHSVMKEAVENAKKGEATLIECFTYRLGDHTTSDDASRYRTKDEVEKWMKKEPISRFKSYLTSKKLLDNKIEEEMMKKIEEMVETAVQKYENTPPAPVSDIFDYVYEKLTPELERQKKEYLDFLQKNSAGGENHA